MTAEFAAFLRPTSILDFEDRSIQALVAERGWRSLEHLPRIAAVYAFVRDDIPFGYNRTDSISAAEVLRDRYGQCNTKTTLLMALLRAVGVPCRIQGATIHKSLQKGVVTGIFYRLAPANILHSWAEVFLNDQWVALEGVILDNHYLIGLSSHLQQRDGPLLGYGVGTAEFSSQPSDFVGIGTSIQMTGVNKKFGAFSDPDSFYAAHGTNMSGLRAWLFSSWVRYQMNRRVATIRGCSRSAACARAQRAKAPQSS